MISFGLNLFFMLKELEVTCFIVGLFCYLLQEELRPYFSLPKVMDGLFGLAKRLFDINIEPADGLAPVSHSYIMLK